MTPTRRFGRRMHSGSAGPGRRLIAVVGVAIAFTFAVAVVAAAPPPTPPPVAADQPTTAESIAARRAELAVEITQARTRLEEATAAGQTAAAEVATREVQLLERLDPLLGQQLDVVQQSREIERTQADLRQQLQTLQVNGPAEPAPYSVQLLDAVRDERRAQEARLATAGTVLSAAVAAHVSAAGTVVEKESAQREARLALEAERSDARAAALAVARLESRVATETLDLRRLELEKAGLEKKADELRVEVLREREKWIRSDTTLTNEDLRAIIVDLEARAERRRTERDLAENDKTFPQDRLFDARSRLNVAGGQDPVLLLEVETWKLEYETALARSRLLGKRIERLSEMKEVWNRRFQFAHGVDDREMLRNWVGEARAALDRLQADLRAQQQDQTDLRQKLVTLEGRLEAARTAAPDQVRWLERQQRSLNAAARMYDENITSIETARRLQERFLDDVGDEARRISFAERVAGIWHAVKAVWTQPLAWIDLRPITIGQIVIGLVLLLLGFFVSRWLARLLGNRVLPRLGMDEGASAAVRSVVFYILIVTFALLALRIINIPLTVFTILGGALAIGVGFGSQNIINNFISGLILLAERPIRVGDLVQIDQLHGTVQHIGARSTIVRTGDNIEIVVPNSRFLEQNVINWTLSETKVRVCVNVGVIYGSPVREVIRLLQKAVEEHGRVMASPAPLVIFEEFGDNALIFEVHFWIRMRSMMDRRIIQSDVRCRIDSLFHEAGLVIAFPQRDVHLDSVRPLEVRLMSGAPDADKSWPPEGAGA